MIALDDNGNFVTDEAGHLTTTSIGPIQNAKSELRCQQGDWPPDLTFGRNLLTWTLSQSVQDRSLDIYRIISKYVNVQDVAYDSITETYNAQVG